MFNWRRGRGPNAELQVMTLAVVKGTKTSFAVTNCCPEGSDAPLGFESDSEAYFGTVSARYLKVLTGHATQYNASGNS